VTGSEASERVLGWKIEAVPAIVAASATAAAPAVMAVRIPAAGRSQETEHRGEKQEGKSSFRVHEGYLQELFWRERSLDLHCSCQPCFYRIASIGDSRAARIAGYNPKVTARASAMPQAAVRP
jgi:hypothetical protein